MKSCARTGSEPKPGHERFSCMGNRILNLISHFHDWHFDVLIDKIIDKLQNLRDDILIAEGCP